LAKEDPLALAFRFRVVVVVMLVMAVVFGAGVVCCIEIDMIFVHVWDKKEFRG